jgi:hypothetical protein
MHATDLSATPGTPAGQRVRPRRHPLLGGLLIKDRLINEIQLEQVLALQEQTEPRPLLGQILVDQKLITPHELNVVLGKYRREHLLGDVLVETNLVTSAQLETALASQRRTDAPLGETLIELRLITERQLKHALSIQLRIAFVDLDDRSIDPALAAVLSERYARHHRVIPIARHDDRLVVAMSDPTDADVIAELRSCTGLRIDVVVATSDALGRALTRLYGAHGDWRPVDPSTIEEVEPARSAPSARATPAPGAGEPGASVREPSVMTPGNGEPGRPGVALDALRARMDPLGHLARSWERWLDAIDHLVRERRERRADVDRVAGQLRESQAALACASQELEAKTQALTRLEIAHAAALQEMEVLERAIGELRTRHDALLADRQFAIDRIGPLLRQLRS